jgi:hypothetical protein
LYYFGSKELAQRMMDLREDTQKGFIYVGDVERINVCQERYVNESNLIREQTLLELQSTSTRSIIRTGDKRQDVDCDAGKPGNFGLLSLRSLC